MVIPRWVSIALCNVDAATLSDARRRAHAELLRPTPCSCCDSLVEHVHRRLGSTFFLDDDPEQLCRAFPASERSQFTPRLLAACVVALGRRRTTVHDRD